MKKETIDFGADKVTTLFGNIFIPTVLGMLSMSAVTTIDGIFIGHGVGSDGIAAVNICVPLLMVLTGVGLMVGMGSSVLASIHLSRGKTMAVRASVTQAMFTVTVVGVVVIAAIMVAPRWVARVLGSSDHLMPLVLDYLVWFAPSLLFELLGAVASFALRLDGSPRLSMWCSVIMAVVNAVLDWLFIFPLGWGVMGAALATTLACMVGAVIAVVYLGGYASVLRFSPLRFDGKVVSFYCHDMAAQCKVGLSALLGEATMAMLMFIGNHVFMAYLGDDGVGAFGISCYYLPFVFMIGNSIAQSAQPIISYNFGAGRGDRVRSAVRISLLTALACGMVSTVAFVFAPDVLVALFLKSVNAAAQIAIDGFPYYGAAFIFFIANLSMIGYFQSVERVRPATAFALLRGFVFLIPSFILLPKVMGVKGIWLALALSEILTTAVVVVFYAFTHRHGWRN